MSQDLAATLHEIQMRQREDAAHLEAPATVAQIAAVQEAVRAHLGADLPEGYAAFLRRSDGVDWNGTVFYATAQRAKAPGRPFLQGVVDANLDLRDSAAARELLALGESGMELYVYGPAGAFRIIDRVSFDTYESFESFDALFEAAMRKRLD